MNPTIIVALIARLVELEKVVVAIKSDVDTLKTSGASADQVQAASADLANQVQTVASDLEDTGAALGLTSGLGSSLLALLGGVAKPIITGVEGLFQHTSATAPTPTPEPAAAPAGTAATLENVAAMKVLVPPVDVATAQAAASA